MSELDRQYVFNKAYRGLRAQGFRRSVTARGDCRYNGPGGTHCAVGWVIPIGETEEGRPCYMLDQLRGLRGSDSAFVFRLQRIHDTSKQPVEMRVCLEDFAYRVGLRIPPDDGQDPQLGVTDD